MRGGRLLADDNVADVDTDDVTIADRCERSRLQVHIGDTLCTR